MNLVWLAILIGFAIDLLIGDPRSIPHPVVLIGKLIDFLCGWVGFHSEEIYNGDGSICKNGEGASKAIERIKGGIVWFTVAALSFLVPFLILLILGKINPHLRLAVETIMCWQILATKGLRDAAMNVYHALKSGSIDDARHEVAMIVGRDVTSLDEKGIIRATVETVAENASDGVIAPLLYMAIGGAPLGFLYKAVNTMDSMLGYTDPPYTNIGFVPAKMDDIFNAVPARIAALLMLLAGSILDMDYVNGWKIFKRDRYNHASPNAAQTEAACAGLLDIQLAGDAYYHGVLHKKKYIGDAIREIEAEDIPRAGKLLYVTSFFALALAIALAIVISIIV